MPADRGTERRPGGRRWATRVLVVSAVLAVLTAGCAAPGSAEQARPGAASSPGSIAPASPASSTQTARSTAERPDPPSRPDPSACRGSGTKGSSSKVPDRLALVGKRGDAWAFAPLDRPGSVTVEGRVSSAPAWSTSKVLVVAAYLDTAVDGRPSRISAADRRLITAALTRSDGEAVTAIRDQIPGRPGRAMTAVLRAIGDTTTVAPDSYQGTMQWSLREQVRFTAALASGRVVSRAASDYLLKTMHPIPAHSWGLGTIGATAFKGGWLRQSTPTRQLGIVDGYAVAISTERGAAVRQTDGDEAHVEQMNRLARLLRQRLTWEQSCR